MNILGISGLNDSVDFKQSQFPGLDPREYRIVQGLDAAAALLCDGKLAAASEEERFSGQKHTGAFPAGAANYCMTHAGIDIRDVDRIAHAFDYAPYKPIYTHDPVTGRLYCDVFSPDAFLRQVQLHYPGFPAARVKHVSHHLAHAASAWLASGWDECLVMVNDAMGEAHGATMYAARDGKLNKLREIPASHSIGILYSLVTLHLGFDFNSDEYKIMGLAPYGNPKRYRSFFDNAVRLGENGSISIPVLSLNHTRVERECYSASREYLEQNLIPARHPKDEITEDHQDVAAALQECLERAVLHIAGHFREVTGLRRAALAGGVALNCTANGKLVRSGVFDDVFFQPVSGDDGAAYGAALYVALQEGEARNERMPPPLYGPSYSASDIEQELPARAAEVDITRFGSLEETCADAAKLIAAGRVIAWFRGRMEYGPRALGNRSIFADPGHPEMRDRINAMVKKREAFRPFAPAVSLDEVDRWFEVPSRYEMPYMITTVMVREPHRAALPAITHVDGSARVQTVSERDNPDFHTLLKEVGRATGREMVLNTSFNVKGQPIVNTPREAIDTFLGTGIEYLYLGDVRLSRKAA